LSFTRAELRAVCTAAGVKWTHDPSNENEKFLRVRLRKFEEMLAAEGLTPQRLSRTMDKIAQARSALEFYAERAFEECVVLEELSTPAKAGVESIILECQATLALSAFRPHPREIQSRVLAAALQAVNPQDYAPGADALGALLDAILSVDFKGRTLGGCVIAPHKGKVRISKER
jgi:tRNA(Ile)-lysidine synthase